MNLHAALAFPAECTASQTRQGKLQGVCLFDRILNPPPTFPEWLGLAWRGWLGLVEITFREWWGPARHCELPDHRHCTVRSAKWKQDWDSLLESLRSLIFPPQWLRVPIAGKGVVTFLGYPS
jgi:hypothetical protein